MGAGTGTKTTAKGIAANVDIVYLKLFFFSQKKKKRKKGKVGCVLSEENMSFT
jgi:hypothetical protein